MFFDQVPQGYLLRLESGEEIQSSLKHLAKTLQIPGAFFHGIGGVCAVEIGFYQRAQKDYKKLILKQDLEMVSLQGNIAQAEGSYIVHSHICLGDEEGKAYAGHLIQATISFTAEILLHVIDSPLSKHRIEELGILAFSFPHPLHGNRE